MENTLALPASPFVAFAHMDPKRIAATTLAIAVHVVVLMTLLMPMATAPATSIDDRELIVVPDIKPIQPIPIAPAPHPVVTQVPPTPRPRPVATPELPVAPVDDTRSPVDTYADTTPPVPTTDFGTPPPAALIAQVAQIAADIAPVPPYPVQGIARRLAGEVVLRIRVDAGGRPVEVTIERSSGSSLLDEAARKFIKARWHFVPAMQDGQAVEAFALLPVNYTLPR